MTSADQWRQYLDQYERRLWLGWRRLWPCEALRLACWLEDDPWE